MSLIDDLNWRYATKKMNGETVPEEKVNYILEAARLAPSSSGLQPYRVLVITNKDLLQQLKSAANNQAQLNDGSHLLVWAAWDGYTHNSISEVFEKTTAARGIPASVMDDYKATLWGMYEPLGKEWHATHAAKQAYISFGMAIAAAAEQKVDATPMEGFDNQAFDKVLGLSEKGLRSVVILPLGYRDAGGDWLLNLKKYRTPREEFVIEMR
ncbi:MAG: nitroreductase family protein [Weeksellaceae bacterium]|nr:nitroreductase family protein [Weeksellaceae bacterium]